MGSGYGQKSLSGQRIVTGDEPETAEPGRIKELRAHSEVYMPAGERLNYFIMLDIIRRKPWQRENPAVAED